MAELKLDINLEKTSITNFESGFKFLGYIFLNSLIVPASPKDTTRFNLSNKGKLSEESLVKIKSFVEPSSNHVVTNVDEEKLKSSELGLAFLEALQCKGLTLEQFLAKEENKTVLISESVKGIANEEFPAETKEAIIPVEAELEEAFLTEEDYYEEAGGNQEEIKSKPELPHSISNFQQTLYLQEQGAIIKKEGGRFFVIAKDKELLDIPAVKISSIVIFGSCTVTPAVIQYCLKKEKPITFLSSRGKYYGSVETTFNHNVDFERIQLLRSLDTNFALALAKTVVKTKIGNTKIILQRHNKKLQCDKIKQVIDNITRISQKIEDAKNIEDVRGYEGVSASNYFSVFGLLLDKSMYFHSQKFKRTKRPPLDPVNSVLSFGYTLLASNIYSFIKIRNLNPYCGFLHAIRTGHPALVSDLIEEFRFVIETLAKGIFNHRILTQKDFYFAKEPGLPCYLTNDARKIFLKQFEIKMHQKVLHKQTGFTVDYRRCLDLQVQQFAKVIKGEKESYEPFKAAL